MRRHKDALPEQWQEFTHPEGDTYFYLPRKKIVTPVDPRDPGRINQVLQAFHVILTKLTTNDDHHFEMVEVWINLGTQDTSLATYYLVDHAHRAIFWADQVKCPEVGLPPVESLGHLSS